MVALGVPRQEIWIKKYKEAFSETVMIGVGGSFDVWSGKVKRAPAIFRSLKLEWLYRITKGGHLELNVLFLHCHTLFFRFW